MIDSPFQLPYVPDPKKNPVLNMANSPNPATINNIYRLERGVIRLRNGKTVPATVQFKGAPLYGKINSSGITKNPGQVNASTGGIASLGSIQKTVSVPNYTFTAGSTSTLTISWSNYATRQIDGTAVLLAAGSISITGLTAGTLYFYYPYWSTQSAQQGWVNGGAGVGLPAIAYTSLIDANVAIQTLQSNFSFGQIFFTQPSSGTGSGTSGSAGGFGATGGGGRRFPSTL